MLCVALGWLSGCSYFREKAAERYVYVTARQTFLLERVAAVSNRTGTVSNGEKMVVLDRARHFLKVRTPRGEVGWIREKDVADQHTADEFAALRADHANDPVVATATVRDEVYLHMAPGRETPHFFRLAEGDSLSLLERASVPKVAADMPKPETAKAAGAKPGSARAGSAKDGKAGAGNEKAGGQRPEGKAAAEEPVTPADAALPRPRRTLAEDAEPEQLPPPVLEDWWLVRNSRGQTGWILAHFIDIAEPDALARYAEGQRIVGAYILAHATDPDSGVLDNGQTVTSIPEYVTVLSPFKAGLPYDFDQVRVFIWNVKKHRYETSFREHNIVGYLPVTITQSKNPYGKAPVDEMTLPTFTYRVLAASAPIPAADPDSGLFRPTQLISKTLRLEGSICRRVLPPNTQPQAEAHPAPDTSKEKNGKSKHKHKG